MTALAERTQLALIPQSAHPVAVVTARMAVAMERKQRRLERETALAEAVFRYWCLMTNHPRAIYSPEREKLIRARLTDVADMDALVSDLCHAVDGLARSEYHRGKYDWPENFARNRSMVEQMMEKTRGGKAGETHPFALDAIAAVDGVR